MKKIVIIIIVLVLVHCAGFLLFINVFSLQENVDLIEVISPHVVGSDTIDFDVMTTDFEWDELLIIRPYADYRRLLKEEKVSWRRIDNHARHSDISSLLIFVNNKKIVAYVNYPRHNVSFGYEHGAFQRDSSKFRVERGTHAGRPWYTIRHHRADE